MNLGNLNWQKIGDGLSQATQAAGMISEAAKQIKKSSTSGPASVTTSERTSSGDGSVLGLLGLLALFLLKR
jgi:hypothetical protein